jgi:hypothetical protein
MTTTSESITRSLVPEHRRTNFVDAMFGINFPMQLEPCIFVTASELSSDYHGGYWHIYALGNGGFHMAPDDDARFNVRSENGYEASMTADALGVTVCLYAFSRLSFAATATSPRSTRGTTTCSASTRWSTPKWRPSLRRRTDTVATLGLVRTAPAPGSARVPDACIGPRLEVYTSMMSSGRARDRHPKPQALHRESSSRRYVDSVP